MMRDVRLSVSMMASMLALLVGPFASAANGNGSISGAVRDTNNVPLVAAEVRAIASDGTITVVLSDAQGRYALSDLNPGKYTVTAYKKFYERSKEKMIDAAKPVMNADFAITSLTSPPATQLSSADITPYLPGPDDEKALFLDRCGRCHSVGTALQISRDADGWNEIFELMRKISTAVITDEIKPQIIDYLTKNFGPDNTLISNFGKEAKTQTQPVPLGSNIEYKQYPPSKRPWEGRANGLPTENHTTVADGKGSAWFTEYRGHSIGRIDLATGKTTEYELKTPGAQPFGMDVTPDGKVWFTAGSVLGNIDPATGEMSEIPVPAFEDRKAGGANSMLAGKDSLLWMCTSAGIDSYNPATKVFKNYLIEDGKGGAIGIAEHGDAIWFGQIRSNKVGYLEPASGEVKTFAIPSPDVVVERLRVDQKGRVWIGEYAAGKLGLLEPGSSQIVEIDLPYRCQPYGVEVDKQGAIWAVCFERSTLIRLDPDTKAMVEYPQPAGSGGIARDLRVDAQGTMWYVEWFGRKVTAVEQMNQPSSVKAIPHVIPDVD
jgi:virginiamycin B lyase